MENAKNTENAAGKITVVGTPIGNLGDLSPRALDALRAADVVCCEDTRVTGKLLAAFGISKRLERLDEALLGARAASIAQRAAAGERVAYCSDAGMPGVSDPGARLVAAAQAAGVRVEVVPGASAVDTAYAASGFVCPRFYFGGFFPRKDGERRQVLESLHSLDAVLIFYESPKRACAALAAIASVFPQRQVAVCRELTKLHEEVVRGAAGQVRDEFAARVEGANVAAAGSTAGDIKGEIVLVIDAPNDEEREQARIGVHAQATAAARKLASSGARAKDIARQLSQQFGISRNDAYEMAMHAAAKTKGE